jgi:acetolactate synthase-1/2/3 large subunit
MAHVREADLILTIGFDPVELRSDWIAPWDEKKATVNIDLLPNTHHVYRSMVEYAGGIAGCLRVLAAAAPKRTPSRWPDADLERYRKTVQHAIASSPARASGRIRWRARCAKFSARYHRHHRHRLAPDPDQSCMEIV